MVRSLADRTFQLRPDRGDRHGRWDAAYAPPRAGLACKDGLREPALAKFCVEPTKIIHFFKPIFDAPIPFREAPDTFRILQKDLRIDQRNSISGRGTLRVLHRCSRLRGSSNNLRNSQSAVQTSRVPDFVFFHRRLLVQVGLSHAQVHDNSISFQNLIFFFNWKPMCGVETKPRLFHTTVNFHSDAGKARLLKNWPN